MKKLRISKLGCHGGRRRSGGGGEKAVDVVIKNLVRV